MWQSIEASSETDIGKVQRMKILMIWIAATGLASCGPALASAQVMPVTNAASPGTASTQTNSADVNSSDDDYRLGPADKIRVLIFDEPALSGEFLVNANGKLSLPLIGDVQAAGVTTTTLASTIQSKLADGFLLEPRVSIDMLTFRPFYILGEVNKPGKYPYSSGLTVLNAVATAEGFTYRASKKSIIIKHVGQIEDEIVPLSSDLRVRPGDTIRIRERHF